MRHDTRQLAVIVENDTVRPRSLTSVKDSAVGHDGEFVVRGRRHEREVLVIVLRMRVVITTDGLSVILVLAAGLLRVVNGVGVVVIIAAACAVRLAFHLLHNRNQWMYKSVKRWPTIDAGIVRAVVPKRPTKKRD